MKTSFVNGGRIAVHAPDMSGANNRGYVLRSRYVMSQHLGRLLRSDEIVHHKNGDKLDDRIENLELTDDPVHTRHHVEHGDCGFSRSLDYELIRSLMVEGCGYKSIAKETGYALSSVKRAVRTLRKELNTSHGGVIGIDVI